MQKIYVMLLLVAFLATKSIGQTEATNNNLPDIVIRENRLELPFSEQSRTIQVLTRAQLDAMPVRTIAEALQQVAGLDIRQRGPFGVQTDLHVRGGGFDQALVLLNGIRLSDPQTGHHLMNLPVDWNAVERIEILKGPGARIYGQNAFACAINIVTKVPTTRLFSVGATAGDFGLLSGNIYAALPGKKYRQQIAVSADHSDGFRYNTDFNIYNVFYQGQWEDKKGGEWRLLADYNQRAFGGNGFYGRLEFRDQYEAIQTNVVGVDYRRKIGNWVVKPRVFWRRNQDYYVFNRQNPTAFQNFHLSQVAGVEANAVNENKLGQTGIGIGLDYTALYSSRLGQRQRTTFNFFAEHRFSLLNNKLDITPGISASNFSDFGFFAFPGLDAGLRLSERWKVFANAGYNYRIPTFTDLYYEDAGNKGNVDLKPEQALALEAGVKYSQNGFLVQAAWFDRNGTNLIDYSKERDADKWQANNFSRVQMRGIDASVEWRSSNTAVWVQQLTAGYTFLDANTASQAAFSRYTLNHLRHQFTAALVHRIAGPVRHSIRLRWCDRVASTAGVKSDYAVADAKIWWQTRRWNVFVEATNLFNATYGELRYSDTAILTMPGRWARGGVVFSGF
jgi:vitamin B12 transporter